jgi:hypothetical protein
VRLVDLHLQLLRHRDYFRELDLTVAINIIADPDWDERRFATVRKWALSVSEIVHLTVNATVSGHRDLAHRAPAAHLAGLSALRRPARRAPHAAAA